jgi:hypothetical protein
MDDEFREPNAYERAILDRLLSLNFPGRAQIAAQLENVRVKAIDEHGCLNFEGTLPGGMRPVVDGYAVDLDGVPIEVILFARDGVAIELEFVKADGSAIVEVPDPELLDVWDSRWARQE